MTSCTDRCGASGGHLSCASPCAEWSHECSGRCEPLQSGAPVQNLMVAPPKAQTCPMTRLACSRCPFLGAVQNLDGFIAAAPM